jgi:hypothetical protein
VRHKVEYSLYVVTTRGKQHRTETTTAHIDTDGKMEAVDILIDEVGNSFQRAQETGAPFPLGKCDGWNGYVMVNPRHVDAFSILAVDTGPAE